MVEMILKNFGEYLTSSLEVDMNNLRCDIVSSIELTSAAFPEQYEFFDKYGYQTGYLRLRHGKLSVRCPDFNDYEVYGKMNINIDEYNTLGSGDFVSNDVRKTELACAIKAIVAFYDDLHMVDCIETKRFDRIFKLKHGDYAQQLALRDLYLYQSSNFTPDQVIKLRRNGPGVTFNEALLQIKNYPNIAGVINGSINGGPLTEDDKTSAEHIMSLMYIIFNKDRTEFEEAWKSLG